MHSPNVRDSDLSSKHWALCSLLSCSTWEDVVPEKNDTMLRRFVLNAARCDDQDNVDGVSTRHSSLASKGHADWRCDDLWLERNDVEQRMAMYLVSSSRQLDSSRRLVTMSRNDFAPRALSLEAGPSPQASSVRRLNLISQKGYGEAEIDGQRSCMSELRCLRT